MSYNQYLCVIHRLEYDNKKIVFSSCQVGKVVVRVISKMMDVDQHVLADAQLKSKACSRYVNEM